MKKLMRDMKWRQLPDLKGSQLTGYFGYCNRPVIADVYNLVNARGLNDLHDWLRQGT